MENHQNSPRKKNQKHPSSLKADLMESTLQSLDEEQIEAFNILQSGENVFLTGGAGSGKSYVIRQLMRLHDSKTLPILASTGAAAVLLGGRTFHSFFGLGILEGGVEATFERACQDARLAKRLNQVEGVIIDEISMIPGEVLDLAERIARNARESNHPWGGLRVIVVGDFLQLPPVTRFNQKRVWAFESSAWAMSHFQEVVLKKNQRTTDSDYLKVLNEIRWGHVTPFVKEYLNWKLRDHDEEDRSTRLFPRRDQSEIFNQKKLAQISHPEIKIPSIYLGEPRLVEALKRNSPIPEELVLKEGCQILFVQNDPNKRWVNGTKGTVVSVAPDKIVVEKESFRHVTVDKAQFSLQDSEGKVVASVINFPVILAYATTIHKSQGATLDDLWVDLSRLWEPGHAYVALSRLRTGQGLKLLRWSEKSIISDLSVKEYYKKINAHE